MKLVEKTLNDFIAEVASPSPAPGGGSVAATAGAMGAALIRMVGHLSVGKKKFLALPEATQTEFKSTVEKMTGLKDCLVRLIDEDTESFNRILAAYQLPKDTPDQIAVRESRIQEATIGAIRVPLETATLSLEVLTHLHVVLTYGNKNCLSDLAVGALMLQAGLEGALLNVETNLSSITDPEITAGYRKKCQEFLDEGERAKNDIVQEVRRRLQE